MVTPCSAQIANRATLWAACGCAASVLILGVVIGAVASAQQSQTPIFKGRLDLIRADVAVIDNRTGEPIHGLKESDFTVLENGARQRVSSFVVLDSAGEGKFSEPSTNDRRRVLRTIHVSNGHPASRVADGLEPHSEPSLSQRHWRAS